jgi:hypothetical protein
MDWACCTYCGERRNKYRVFVGVTLNEEDLSVDGRLIHRSWRKRLEGRGLD